jgi:hypothetical protein
MPLNNIKYNAFNIKTTNNNFALVLIITFTGKQSYYNGQYMYLFTQQLYIINRSKVTKKCI